LKVTFFPYIKIPTRYILAESQTKNIHVAIKTITDTAICQAGGENANLDGITIGENNGNIDDQTAKLLLGDFTATIMIYKASTTGIVIGIVNA